MEKQNRQKRFHTLLREEIFRNELTKNNEALIPIFLITSIMGTFFVILFVNFDIPYDSEHGTFGNASAIISGYTVTLLSLMCVVLLGPKFDYSSLSIMYNIIGIFTIIIICYSTWINITHFKKINHKKLPNDYNTYRTWSLILIFAQQIYLVYGRYAQPDIFFNILMLIITLFNVWYLLIQSIILDKFSVDVI